jgi:hypothetical protein
MVTIYPQKVLCNIIDFSLVSDVSWFSVFPIILFQFFQREFSLAPSNATPNSGKENRIFETRGNKRLSFLNWIFPLLTTVCDCLAVLHSDM